MRGGRGPNEWARLVSDAHQGTIEGGYRAGLSHQSLRGGGSEVTLAPHLVQNTLTGRSGGGVERKVVMLVVGGRAHAQTHVNTCYICN